MCTYWRREQWKKNVGEWCVCDRLEPNSPISRLMYDQSSARTDCDHLIPTNAAFIRIQSDWNRLDHIQENWLHLRKWWDDSFRLIIIYLQHMRRQQQQHTTVHMHTQRLTHFVVYSIMAEKHIYRHRVERATAQNVSSNMLFQYPRIAAHPRQQKYGRMSS